MSEERNPVRVPREMRPLFVKPARFTARVAWLSVFAFWAMVAWACV